MVFVFETSYELTKSIKNRKINKYKLPTFYTRQVHEQQNQLLCPWLAERYQVICLKLSISILHCWAFITKPMRNRTPEITIYLSYDLNVPFYF